MKQYVKKLSLGFMIISSIYFLTGCGSNDNHDHMNNDEMNNEHMEETQHLSDNHTHRNILDSTVVRSKDVDIASLNKNGDGMLFQCPMDYQVISDEAGNCPLCKMELEEFSVDQTKTNFNNYMN